MMKPRQEIGSGTAPGSVSTTNSPTSSFRATRESHPGLYHPSALLRRALARGTRQQNEKRAQEGPSLASPAALGHAPPLRRLLGASLAVGALSGFLEMSVQAIQVRVLHRVDWTSLMFNRHYTWLVVIVPTLVTVCVALFLLSPALLWAKWRARRGASADRFWWTWGLAGTTLGTLLLLGPLQAIQGFHPAAPLALAIGAGVQLRRIVVRRSAAWLRISRVSGLAVVCLLPLYSLWQWHNVKGAGWHAWSQPASKAPNLLFIVLDTLRADHMSLYGYNRSTTPQLDAWSKEGITFDMARSAAPWTLPSHVTMFTGLWPTQHGARVDQPYFGAAPTLAEHLRSRGYATAGVVANVRMCNQVYGVGRGFDTYIDYPWNQEVSFQSAMASSKLGATVLSTMSRLGLPAPHHFPLYYRRPARAITREARQWLDQVRRRNESGSPDGPRPYFLFVNLMDVHGPYVPRRNAARSFWTGPLPEKLDASPECGWLAVQQFADADAGERRLLQKEVDAVSNRLGDLYDECLHGMDAELGRFLGGLRADGMLENTWVVITADHGEHFGEHGHFGHGSSLYNAMTHVPLILIPPSSGNEPGLDISAPLRGRRVGVPISQRDLPHTIASLLEPAGANPFPGRGLARYWSDNAPGPPDPVLSQLEDPRLRGESFRTENVIKVDSLIEDDRILIESINQPPELYDLYKDPRQHRNLAGQPEERSRLERMRYALGQFLSDAGPVQSE
jgi:arylsulfatase A-like enzyme